MTTLMAGRRGLITGIANARSIAWGIAQAAKSHGAELVLTYQSDRLRQGVEALGQQLGAADVIALDVTSDAHLERAAQKVAEKFDALDFVVHGTAFAHKEDLAGRFSNVGRPGFAAALDVSAYALVALAKTFLPLLKKGVAPSVLTLTYLGAERAMPNYNVMGVAKAALEACVRYLAADLGADGIRVNALSPGPIRTLSAAGIPGMRAMLNHVACVAPLGRNVLIDDIGDAALFALSALGRGMTGEVVHVDGGYHILGAPGLSAAQAKQPSSPTPPS